MSCVRIELAVAEGALVVEWTLTSGGSMLLHDSFNALPCVEELEKLPRCFNPLQISRHSYASILEWLPASLSSLMESHEFKYYGLVKTEFSLLTVSKTPLFESIFSERGVGEKEEQGDKGNEVVMPNSSWGP